LEDGFRLDPTVLFRVRKRAINPPVEFIDWLEMKALEMKAVGCNGMKAVPSRERERVLYWQLTGPNPLYN